MMLPDTGNPPADARELGRALMRGDRDELFQRAELDASRIYQTFTDGAIAGAKESATGRTYPG